MALTLNLHSLATIINYCPGILGKVDKMVNKRDELVSAEGIQPTASHKLGNQSTTELCAKVHPIILKL